MLKPEKRVNPKTGMVYIDHDAYQRWLRAKSRGELLYIIKDAREAIEADPYGHSVGYYADEMSYASMELRGRTLGW
jgi:hypothetical protein